MVNYVKQRRGGKVMDKVSKYILENLVKLANDLDQKQLYDEASEVDTLINRFLSDKNAACEEEEVEDDAADDKDLKDKKDVPSPEMPKVKYPESPKLPEKKDPILPS